VETGVGQVHQLLYCSGRVRVRVLERTQLFTHAHLFTHAQKNKKTHAQSETWLKTHSHSIKTHAHSPRPRRRLRSHQHRRACRCGSRWVWRAVGGGGKVRGRCFVGAVCSMQCAVCSM
jgi:hypothetical protein